MEFVTEINTVVENYKPSIAIDFDGVIHINDLPDHSISGKIIDGAKEAIDNLKEQFKIVIYSARVRPDFGIEKGIEEITNFLNENNIYFDEVSICKPVAKFYIDDRAIRFISWDDALQQVQNVKQAAGPVTRKRRDQHEMTHTQHDPSIDEPTLQNNYPENTDVKASVFKMKKLSKYLQATNEPLEIKVTNINGEYHVRLLDKGKLHSEMACKEKQDIGYCTQEMLRWYDKMGGISPMAEASRNRQKNQTPIGKTRKIK